MKWAQIIKSIWLTVILLYLEANLKNSTTVVVEFLRFLSTILQKVNLRLYLGS